MSDKEANYGKTVFEGVVQLTPQGHKVFFDVKEKEGIKYPSFSSYAGWDYVTKWGAKGKRFPMTIQGMKSLRSMIDDMIKLLES